MPPSNSSTSNSNPPGSPESPRKLPKASSTTSGKSQSPVGQAVRVLLWTLLWLGAMDVGVNVLFVYPKTPNAKPSKLQQYFEYGRSTEGKIRYMVGKTNATTASVSLAGWMDDSKVRPTTAAQPDGMLVAVYGQSFTQHAANAWAKQNDKLTLRMILGPGAPLNHSYASYLEDRHKHDAKVCLLGVLASSLPYLDTIAGMTWSFERPYTFMFPRYSVHDGKLSVIDPTIHSMQQFREVLNDPVRWAKLRNYVQKYDAFFDPLTFNANVLDHSVIARMLRRAWGQRHMQKMQAFYHTDQGYNAQSGITQTARFLVVDWAKKVREDGRFPIVYIINDRGFSDHLYQELGATLREHKIAYVSTHEYAPAGDLSNFQPDGHFIHAVDDITARKFQALVDQQFPPVSQ